MLTITDPLVFTDFLQGLHSVSIVLHIAKCTAGAINPMLCNFQPCDGYISARAILITSELP